MAEENGEVSISTPVGSIKTTGKRMAETITVISLCLTFLLTYVLWEHKEDSKVTGTVLQTALKEMTNAQRSSVEAQRELNCLIALGQDERRREFMSPSSLCKQLSRER